MSGYVDSADPGNLLSRMQGDIRGLARRQRGALVTRTVDLTAQNITAAAMAVPFDSETFDTDAIHDNSTNNTRLTVPSGWEWVRLASTVRLLNYSVLSGRYMALYFRKNGSDVNFVGNGKATLQAVGNPSFGIMSGALNVTAGDYFEVMVFGTGDTSVDIASYSWFEMELLA